MVRTKYTKRRDKVATNYLETMPSLVIEQILLQLLNTVEPVLLPRDEQYVLDFMHTNKCASETSVFNIDMHIEYNMMLNDQQLNTNFHEIWEGGYFLNLFSSDGVPVNLKNSHTIKQKSVEFFDYALAIFNFMNTSKKMQTLVKECFAIHSPLHNIFNGGLYVMDEFYGVLIWGPRWVNGMDDIITQQLSEVKEEFRHDLIHELSGNSVFQNDTYFKDALQLFEIYSQDEQFMLSRKKYLNYWRTEMTNVFDLKNTNTYQDFLYSIDGHRLIRNENNIAIHELLD